MDVAQLFEYGVGIAGIVGMIIVVMIFMKFISNHIEESTKSSQKLSDSIDQLIDFLKNKRG